MAVVAGNLDKAVPRVDVAVDASPDGLRLTVHRLLSRFDTPIELNGKPSWVTVNRTWFIDGRVAEATPIEPCDALPTSASMPAAGAVWLEARALKACADPGPFTSLAERQARLILRDGVTVASLEQVEVAALGRSPSGEPVYALQRADGGVALLRFDDGGASERAVPELAAMPDAGLDYLRSPRLVLSTGPVFAIASNKGMSSHRSKRCSRAPIVSTRSSSPNSIASPERIRAGAPADESRGLGAGDEAPHFDNLTAASRTSRCRPRHRTPR